MVNLITTDSYFNIFPLLNKRLEGKVNGLDGKNLIFCEEKISLMAERSILSFYGGSFNTVVYSFGNYLRANYSDVNALTKEGSAMAIKRILNCIPLSCFRASKTTLSSALYDVIIQLKSAKVTPKDLEKAVEECSGTLKNKLIDIASVYQSYENFILEQGFEDQSSILNHLPQIITADESIPDTDVYIVGFNGFTCQIRSAISTLLKRAKSVTAILVEGENQLVYVNETSRVFRSLVKDAGLDLIEERQTSQWTKEGEIIASNLFNPCSLGKVAIETDKIFTLSAPNKMAEAEQVAEIIRQKVMSGECKYKDMTVALYDVESYRGEIERAFGMLEIPCFLDQKKKVSSHPLVRLILSYVDAFRKNLQKSALAEFYKNPLFSGDKELSDEFENYVLCYNVDFSRIKNVFTYENKGSKTLEELNLFREKIVNSFSAFSPRKLIKDLDVENSLKEYSILLGELNEFEEQAVNDQIYSAVQNILGEMDMMLGQTELSLVEFKNVFESGIMAMEISIIPQHNDAVFVGGLKETALAKAKYLFVLGLTSDVPAVKEDVALLSDGDISLLEDVKVLVEPTIKVVNHRAREYTALALSAFSNGLYLSYPILSDSGDKTVKSSALLQIEETFNVNPFPKYNGYLAYKQGLSTFARDCGDFTLGKNNDFTWASSFFSAVGEKELSYLLQASNKQIKLRLDTGAEVMTKEYVAPTRIEDYYKCPYRAFLSNALKLKRREEGVVDGFSVGNIMHGIFEKYTLQMHTVTDEESSNKLVFSIAEELLKDKEYERYLTDPASSWSVRATVLECAKFCYRNYLAIKNSKFKVSKTEAKFGDGKDCDYPAISLNNGRVKMTGKIDRVDEGEQYFRILDYKTKSNSADVELLFTGKKLQLYLYAKAVSQKLTSSKLAGLYYMPIADNYLEDGEKVRQLSNGLTLDDDNVINMHDGDALTGEGTFLRTKNIYSKVTVEDRVSEQGLNALMDYSVLLSEKAVERMQEGVIAPSACDEMICGYCDYKSICPHGGTSENRNHGKVDYSTIIEAVGGENNA